jgi:enoyl-CoA hydratase/carnithine racemase
MMNYEQLCVKIESGVCTLQLNRPKKRNALSLELLRELVSLYEHLKQSDDVHLLVLEGAGPSFSVGFDLGSLAQFMMAGQMPDASTLKEWAVLGQDAVNGLAELPQVTLAVVHGHAIGGGFLLMSACDFRIAIQGTRFSLPEIDIGLPLTWGGVARVTQELGPALSKDLIFTARSFGPEDLDKTHFLYKVISQDQRSAVIEAWLACLQKKPAVSLRACKTQFLASRSHEEMKSPLDAQLFADAVLHPDFLPTALAYVQGLKDRSS